MSGESASFLASIEAGHDFLDSSGILAPTRQGLGRLLESNDGTDRLVDRKAVLFQHSDQRTRANLLADVPARSPR
jgi:hypothetical protein